LIVGAAYLGLTLVLSLFVGLFGIRALMQALPRLAVFGLTIGGGVALGRILCRTETNRLFSFRFVKGEWSAAAGVLAGIMAVGAVAEWRGVGWFAGQSRIKVGQALDISGPTLGGEPFDLANNRGKLTLVDFWATWCGPCVAELPSVQAAYDKYHSEGLEVVGVSFDSSREQLDAFLINNPHPWPQIFFEEEASRGVPNPLGERYGIEYIPCLVLVDREGRVAATELYSGNIEAAVAAALGDPVHSTATSGPKSWLAIVARMGRQALVWLAYGLVVSRWWSLFVGGLAGAVVLASAEAAVRRMMASSD
jgi:thiol-disulfide isomerase/thioredoxin